MLKGEAAFENAEASRQRYEAEKLKVFRRVKDVYYEYYFLGRSLAIIKENLRLFKQLEKVVMAKYDTAEFKYQDLIRVQIETVKFAERVDSLRDFKRPLLAKLKYALNWSDGDGELGAQYPERLDLNNIETSSFNEYEKLIKRNPRLREIEHKIAMEDKRRQIAWRRFIPDITLGVDYIQTDKSSTRVNDNGKDPIIAMISLNLPIYFTKYTAERREAVARKTAFEFRKVDMGKLLFSELETLWYGMKDSKRKMLVYRDNLIPKAEKSLDAIRESYVNGKASYLDFIDAQQTLLRFKLVYEEKLVKYLKSIAAIEELAGREI